MQNQNFKIGVAVIGASLIASGISLAQNNQIRDKASMIIEEQCSRCHSTEKINQEKGKYDVKEWEETVDRMIKKGAKIDLEQKKLIIDYLSSFQVK